MTIDNAGLCVRSVVDAPDGHRILIDTWQPQDDIIGLIHIFHGLGEHAARYDRFAQACVSRGYVVCAHNHRGHGENCAPDNLGHYADADGWDTVINDALQVQQSLTERFPNHPLILLGHSMGSYIAQSFAMRHPESIDVLILSGSTWPNRLQLRIGRLFATIAVWLSGRQAKSELLNKMSFGDFNKPFAPNRTDFDWLSRDPGEVDKYIVDPLCGDLSSNQLWRDLLGGMLEYSTKKALKKVPEVPVLIFGGELDPVGGADRLTALSKAYEASGHSGVALNIYSDGRHEMLNETNRDAVTSDILDWCDLLICNRPDDTGH